MADVAILDLTLTALARGDAVETQRPGSPTIGRYATVNPILMALESSGPLYSVKESGAVGDGSTDDLPAFDAAVSAAVAGGYKGVVVPYTANGYSISGTWAIPATLELHNLGQIILTTGAGFVPAVQIGDPTGAASMSLKTHRLGRVGRAANSDWSSEGLVGVEIINADTCDIHSVEIGAFTRGLVLRGLTRACAYNTLRLGKLTNCQIDLDLVADGVGGYVNENHFLNGRFSQQSSTLNTALDVTGVRLRQINGSTNVPNNNVFIKLATELSADLRDGDTYPVHILSGNDNVFQWSRHETGQSLYMRVDSGIDNVAVVQLTGASGDPLSLLIQDNTAEQRNVVIPYEVLRRNYTAWGDVRALTPGATVSWDLGIAPVASLVLGEDTTVNVSDGTQWGKWRGRFVLIVEQDGTGSRTLTLGTGFAHSPTLPTIDLTAGAKTVLTFQGTGSDVILAGG